MNSLVAAVGVVIEIGKDREVAAMGIVLMGVWVSRSP
jgi:hypothetical protein